MKTKILITFSQDACEILDCSEKTTFEEKVQELKDRSLEEDYDFKIKEFGTSNEADKYIEGVRDANGWNSEAVIHIEQ